MATPATIWATNAGAGLKDGTSLANAAVTDPSDADDVWTIVNALGALSQNLEIRLCGDASTTATIPVTKDATTTYRITLQGRNAGDTAYALTAVDAGDGAFKVFTFTASDFWIVRDIHATNTDEAAGNHGFSLMADADYMTFIGCKMSHCNYGFDATASPIYLTLVDCWADLNASRGFSGIDTSICIGCVASSSGIGFVKGHHVRGIAYDNTFDGFNGVHSGTSCTAYNSGRHGFFLMDVAHSFVPLADCIAVGSGGYGYQADAATVAVLLQRCASYNNTSGRDNSGIQGHWIDVAPVVLTADPFVDAASGDFALNTTAGGGALCREATGILSADGLTTSYHDRGAAQSGSGVPGNMTGGLQ